MQQSASLGAHRPLRAVGRQVARRLSKRPPGLVDLFCGGGGCSEGARRAGFSVHGVDVEEQPDFVRRFGDDAFTLSDALLPDEVRRACARVSLGHRAGSEPPVQIICHHGDARFHAGWGGHHQESISPNI